MGFRSDIRELFGRNSDAFPSFAAMVFSHPGASFSVKAPASFLWVSEVTLGIFGVPLWGFAVLHCHGVFPSGDQQQQQQKPLQKQEEKVAKIHSSSKRKKSPKSSFHHHFLWVSEVTLGIFGVPFWGFSVLHCHGVFPSGDQQQQQQKPLQKQEEKVAKIHSSSKRKKSPKSSFHHHFLRVSEVTLGIFGVPFWGFSVLHCHGVFPSGRCVLNRRSRRSRSSSSSRRKQKEKVAKICVFCGFQK